MDEQNPRLAAERMTGRRDEQLTGYDTSAVDPRAPEQLRPQVSRETTRTGAAASATPEPRTREIRAEIEQTREEMSETVNAIQERLRPGNIASNAAETVKHAARERVRDVADSESVQYVRANPIPTAMVGLGIAGLAWLAFGGNESQRYGSRRYRSSQNWGRRFDEDRQRTYGTGEAYSGYQAAGGYTPGLAYGESDAYYRDSSRDHTSEYGGDYTGATSGGSAWQGGTAQDVSARARQSAARARESASRAQYAARQTWNENPLLVGAASAVIGAVIGMAIPETDREHELMGEARDGLVDTVQETVKEKVGQVQEAATNAVNTVQDAARATGLTSSGSESGGTANTSGGATASRSTTGTTGSSGSTPGTFDRS